MVIKTRDFPPWGSKFIKKITSFGNNLAFKYQYNLAFSVFTGKLLYLPLSNFYGKSQVVLLTEMVKVLSMESRIKIIFVGQTKFMKR